MTLKRASLAVLVALAFAPAASAQVVSRVEFDGKLGAAGTIAGPAYAISDTRGQYVGTNLFHSFKTFNLVQGDVATFSGLAGTRNVVARVTGGPSSIDGALASDIAGANLWFLNPAGIVFGENASLNLTGSFHASTASTLKFGASGSFDMINPPAASLTVDPSAFGFLGAPAAIEVRGSQLQVAPGKELSLVAGELIVDGGAGIATLHAPGGRINLAAAKSGEISLDPAGLGATGVAAFGRIALDWSDVFTEAGGAAPSGPIYIRGGQIAVDNTFVSTRHASAGPGADIVIDAAEGYSQFGSIVRTSSVSTGDAGNVALRAASVSLSGLSVIDASAVDLDTSSGSGRAGQVTVEASGAVSLSGGALISAITVLGSGPAGDLSITAGSLSMSGGSRIQASTFGDGDGGSVRVEAGSVSLSGGSRIETSSGDEAYPAGFGKAGDIVVNAGGVALSGPGTGLYSSSNTFGDAGAINVTARAVQLSGGASIDAVTTGGLGAGGGVITILASDSLALSDSSIRTSVTEGGGNGGNIVIDPVFVVLNNSSIVAQAVLGNGGNIDITTQNFISNGSVVDASSQFGLDGTVQISAPNLDTSSGLTVLPAAYAPSALLGASCAARSALAGSTFMPVPRGGLPSGPDSSGFSLYALGTTPLAQLAAAAVAQAGAGITRCRA